MVFHLVIRSPAPSQVRLRVGDRVQVRDSDYEPCKKGIVKKLVNGRPKVQLDGKDESYWWNQVQPLVGAQVYSHVSH